MADLRPSTDLAVDEARREWPSSRYQFRECPRHGVVEVYDLKAREVVATVYGMTDEGAS